MGRRNVFRLSSPVAHFILLVIFFHRLIECSEELDGVVVKVRGGSLKGTVMEGREGTKYFAFLGVPYASVSLRFEAPEPYPPWDGVRDATQYGPVCPQLAPGGTSTVIGEENCHFLNVYTRNVTGNIPILVFVHGGHLMVGSGSVFGASYFMEHDIILITIQYRLNSLGFLSTHDAEIQGNAGLKDQNMALRWIKENSIFFGGDPSRITIMGQGAGAASVAYHILSPMSKGLFHNCIMQSGGALNPQHDYDRNPKAKAIDLAESLDCPTASSKEMADCLRTVDYRKIVQMKMNKWHLDPLVQYPPTLETLREGQRVADVFLTEDPSTVLEEGRFNRVPCVTGVMEQEGLLFHSAYVLRNLELQRNLNLNWNSVAPITLYYPSAEQIVPDQMHQISRTIRGFYFGNRKVSPETSTNLTNLYSDRLFNWGVRSISLLMARWVPVYPYMFSYLGEYSTLRELYGAMFPEAMVPTHGDDLQYFFNSSKYPNLDPHSRSEEMSKAVVKLWSSFASTGYKENKYARLVGHIEGGLASHRPRRDQAAPAEVVCDRHAVQNSRVGALHSEDAILGPNFIPAEDVVEGDQQR